MRNVRCLQVLLLVVSAVLLASPAHAIDRLTFSAPGISDVAKDDLLSIVVGFEFDDLTVGGGFDLAFSTDLFAYHSFQFDYGLGDDPAFRMQPADDESVGPLVIAFGSFSGLTGTREVGILQLLAKEHLTLGEGFLLLSAVSNLSPAGPFVDALGDPLSVEYVGLYGRVVPEPSTLLLVCAGIAGLSIRARRVKSE